MDTRWYLDVNHWARSTPWAHAFMHAYALWAGVVALGVLLVAGWWRSRGEDHAAVAGALWAGFGTLAAVGINQPVSHLVGRVRPYDTLRGVEVLVPRAHDFTFPSDHATAAGAVICGLLLARRTRLAAVAAVLGLFLAFARVYVGAHYPGDVAGGLVLGAVVVAALRPLAMRILAPIVDMVARSPVRGLVEARSSRAGAPTRPSGHASGTPAEAH